MTPSGKIEELVLDDIINNKKTLTNLGIRLAPLIDVIFQLLIFFFISAQFRPEEAALPLGLPTAQADSLATAVEPLTIYVLGSSNGCEIQIEEETINITAETGEKDLADFVEKFADILKKQKRALSDPLVLVFDDEVQWDYVTKIYNLLYGLGANDITFRLNTEIQ